MPIATFEFKKPNSNHKSHIISIYFLKKMKIILFLLLFVFKISFYANSQNYSNPFVIDSLVDVINHDSIADLVKKVSFRKHFYNREVYLISRSKSQLRIAYYT